MFARLVLGAWTLHTTVGMERSFNASVAGRMDGLSRCGLYVVGPKPYTALVVRNDVRERERRCKRCLDRPLGGFMDAKHTPQVDRIEHIPGEIAEVVLNRCCQIFA
jgi:hypothetical protein